MQRVFFHATSTHIETLSDVPSLFGFQSNWWDRPSLPLDKSWKSEFSQTKAIHLWGEWEFHIYFLFFTSFLSSKVKVWCASSRSGGPVDFYSSHIIKDGHFGCRENIIHYKVGVEACSALNTEDTWEPLKHVFNYITSMDFIHTQVFGLPCFLVVGIILMIT